MQRNTLELSRQRCTRHRLLLVGTIEGGGYENTLEECRRVYGTEGISPTVTAKRGGYHEVKIAIKNNNSKGYMEAGDGDFINLQYTSSSTRRGRVGEGVAQTLCCTDEQGVVRGGDDANNLRIRKLTPLECWRI